MSTDRQHEHHSTLLRMCQYTPIMMIFLAIKPRARLPPAPLGFTFTGITGRTEKPPEAWSAEQVVTS
jgi:hypothetical protein